MAISGAIRAAIKGSVGAVIPGAGGGGTTTARFAGDPFIEGTNDSSVTIQVRRASVGATYEYTITSSGGGTPVTGTNTVAAENFDITGINLTGLNPGALSLSYEEDSVEVATDTALLLPPFDDASFDSDDITFDSNAYTFDGVTA